MNLEDYARQELEFAGLFSKESDYEGMLGKAVMELVKVFSAQGHSGMTASATLNLFNRVARYEPIRALQGTDNEWIEVGNNVKQNKRCSRVFYQPDRGYYDLDGIIFVDLDGARSTNRESMTKVVFPYVPKSLYVKRDINGKYQLPLGVEQVYPPTSE